MNRLSKKITPNLSKIFPFFFLFLFLNQSSVFSEINLSKSSTDSVWPAIAVNSAGEIMVVWSEFNAGQNYYSIFKGGQWSSPKICGITAQQAWTNELSVDSYGMFHISYADGYASSTRDIMYSYFTGNGWASPEKTYRSPWNSAWNKMDIDSNNDIHILWHHSYVGKDASPSSDIITMSKKRMGSWPSGYENVSRQRVGPSICPAIAVKNGNVYACWMEGQNPRRLYFSEKIGGRWSTPVVISGMPCYYLDIDTDDSRNLHIVSGSKTGNFCYISRVGGKWTPVEILSSGHAPRQHGDIECKNNMAVAVFTQGPEGKWSVYATMKALGGSWSVPVKIADSYGGEYGNKHVRVAIDNQSNAHIIYEKVGVGGKKDIFYEKYSLNTPEDATFIEVDNSYLSFQTDENTSNPSSQTFNVRASGAGSINYTLSKDKGWISVSPLQGDSSGGWNSHSVSVDASNLNDGTYYGTITITDPDAYNNPVEVGISLTVGKGGGGGGGGGDPSYSAIGVDQTNLVITMQEGKNPAAKSFNLRAEGASSLSYTISTNKPWLSASPRSGTAGTTWIPVSVFIDADTKRPGTYMGRIDISAPGASKSKTSVSVTLTIEKKAVPVIQTNKSHFHFWGYANGDNPSSETFTIMNAGQKTLNYKITANKKWVKINPSQGSSNGEKDTIKISVDNSGLGVNKHKGTIQITAAGADNSPHSMSVEFEVVYPPQPYHPINITTKRINHEGLMVQEYKSEVEWKANPRNQGLFDIAKYRIFRKDKRKAGSFYVYIAEVEGNTFVFHDSGFPSKQERNKYIYAVASVDSSGKESLIAESQ